MDDNEDDNNHQLYALMNQIRDYMRSRMINTSGTFYIPTGVPMVIHSDSLEVYAWECHECPRTNITRNIAPFCCVIRTWHRQEDGYMAVDFYEHVSPHLSEVMDALERMWRANPDRWLPHLEPQIDEHAPLPAP